MKERSSLQITVVSTDQLSSIISLNSLEPNRTILQIIFISRPRKWVFHVKQKLLAFTDDQFWRCLTIDNWISPARNVAGRRWYKRVKKIRKKKKKEENFLITLFYFLLSFVNARTVFNSDIVQILFVMWPFLRQIRRMAKSHSQNMLVEWDFFSRRLTNSPETIDTAVIGNIQIFPIVCRYCKWWSFFSGSDLFPIYF